MLSYTDNFESAPPTTGVLMLDALEKMARVLGGEGGGNVLLAVADGSGAGGVVVVVVGDGFK